MIGSSPIRYDATHLSNPSLGLRHQARLWIRTGWYNDWLRNSEAADQVHWYLIYTKPRQEEIALENLERQGFECYLPRLPAEKLCKGLLAIAETPLFPRYLFVRLGLDFSSKSWAPIRSTLGVSQLVRFGAEPAKVADELIDTLRENEARLQAAPEQLFKPGERVRLTESPFAGIVGAYQIADGERRALVLIEILRKQVVVPVALANLRRAH